MNNIKIFICHHAVPARTVSNELFATLVSGAPDAPDGSYLGDLGGENIASENIYSEIRHQYFVWKNLLGAYDFVGFEHYRRMFFIDPMPAAKLAAISPELLEYRRFLNTERWRPYLDVPLEAYDGHWAMREQFDGIDILRAKQEITRYDLITQRPWAIGTVEEQYRGCFPWAVDWSVIVEAFRSASYFRNRPCAVDSSFSSSVWNNMYIMRASLFHEYMTLLMDCTRYLLANADVTHFNRAFGHIGERIFNLFLFNKLMERPSITIGHLPFILHTPAFVDRHDNVVAQATVES